MLFDIIIIGGGIAGLYTLYSLSKKHPNLKILLLEKGKNLGGRIYTYKDQYMTLEAGAGRFSDTNILFFQRDVTQRILASEELALAKRTAEQASQAKSHFVSHISHELRTPLKYNSRLFRTAD